MQKVFQKLLSGKIRAFTKASDSKDAKAVSKKMLIIMSIHSTEEGRYYTYSHKTLIYYHSLKFALNFTLTHISF